MNDKPTKTLYYKILDCIPTWKVKAHIWFKGDNFHRDNNLPAIIIYRRNGQVERRSWMRDDKFHRDNDQPAEVTYYER